LGKGYFSVEWSDSGNQNGLVEPGELALGKIFVAFDPPAGSTIIFPGGGPPHTVKALSYAAIGFLWTENGDTGKLDGSWTAPFGPLSGPVYGGNQNITFLECWQPPIQLYPTPNTSNPAHIFTFTWDPLGNYTPRQVTYYVDGISTKVYAEPETTPDFWVGAALYESFDSAPTSFQVVPAPGGATSMLIASSLLLHRRRR